MNKLGHHHVDEFSGVQIMIKSHSAIFLSNAKKTNFKLLLNALVNKFLNKFKLLYVLTVKDIKWSLL